ncbi:hypothetical protein WDU94_002329 [Cyamophila willieti]
MNLIRRSAIFATFVGSCLSIALLAAALGTKYWVTASAKRTSYPNESDGRVHFGLFQGERSLNVGIGWRHYQFSVLDILKAEPEFISQSLWTCLVLFLVLSILLDTLNAIVSLINTTTTPISSLAGIPGLYVYNLIVVLLESITIGLWVYQFSHSLQRNVMIQEDRKNSWSSQGRASLGYSFWFVTVSSCLHIINVFILYMAQLIEVKSQCRV